MKRGKKVMKIPKIVFYFTVIIMFITKNLIPASIDGTTTVKYLTTNQVFHNNEYARGYVTLNSGATILSDATAFLNIKTPFSGGLDLRETGTLSLEGSLYLDTNFTLSGSGVIRGNGKTIFLNGNLTIPDNSIIHINSDTIIDGQGKDLIFGRRGRIFVDTNVTLTLRNMRIVQNFNDFSDPCVRLAAFKSNLTLDNVELALSQNFLFPQGQLFIHGDVVVTGTSAFVYQSTQHAFINQNSTFCFDIGTTFSIVPATFTDCRFDNWPTYTSNNFIKMIDKTSKMHFNEASLCTSVTGCRFSEGGVDFENRCFLKSSSVLNLPQTSISAQPGTITTGFYPNCVSWSPNGDYIAVVDKVSNVLQIFDSITLAQIGSDVTTGTSPVAVSWSNTSTQLVVVNSGDETVKVFNFSGSNTPTFSVSASTGTSPSCCAWSLYGKYIAVTNSGDNSVQVFNAATLSPIGSAAMTENLPSSVSWAPGNVFAVTNLGSNSLQIFSFDGVNTPIQVANYSDSEMLSPISVSWSNDSLHLSVVSSASNTTKIFSFDGGLVKLVDTISSFYLGLTPISVAWSVNGRYLAFVNYTSNTLQFLNFTNQSATVQVGGNASTGSGPESVAFSPVDNFIAVVNSSSNTLQVFSFDGSSTPSIIGGDASTGNGPKSVSWSSDGQFIAVVNSSSNTLQVFSFDGVGTPVLISGNATTESTPQSVSWSPTGDFIVVANGGSNSIQVFLFDESSTSTLSVIGGAASTGSNPKAAAWSPDGKFISVLDGVYPPKLKIFSFNGVAIPIQVAAISLNWGYDPISASWSPEGRFIAIANYAGWRIQIVSFNGINLLNYVGSDVEIGGNAWAISWSPDGRFIAALNSTYGKLSVFSFNGFDTPMKVCQDVSTGSAPHSVSWDLDSKFISVANNGSDTLQVFSVAAISSQSQVSDGISTKHGPVSLSWSPDNVSCAVASSLENNLEIFKIQQPSSLSKIGNDVYFSSALAAQWSPNGKFIASVSFFSPVFLKVFMFNGVSTPSEVGSISVTGNSTGLSWSPDGRFIAVVNSGSLLSVFSCSPSGMLTLVDSVLYSYGVFNDVVWSPDGKYIAVANVTGGELNIFSFTGVSVSLIKSVGVSLPVAVSWSADGRFIAVSSQTNGLAVYSFSGVEAPIAFVDGMSFSSSVESRLAWSQDGRFVAVAIKTLNILNVFAFNGSRLMKVGGDVPLLPDPSVVVWSPDGKFLGVGYNTNDKIQIFSFDGVGYPIQVGGDFSTGWGASTYDISWSLDGAFIAVCNGLTGSIKVFRVNYSPDRSPQAISNGVVFGNSELGSDYDTAVSVLAGSKVYVDGKVNYDCVN